MRPNEEHDAEELGIWLRASYRHAEPPQAFVEQLQTQLLQALEDSCPRDTARPVWDWWGSWHHITSRMKGLTMRQRLAAFGGLGVAALLGFLLLWGGFGPRAASAMERMVEQVRQAKSMKCSGGGHSTTVTELGDSQPAKKSTHEFRSTSYWLAPDSLRTETTGKTDQGPEQSVTIIVPGGGRPWISIDHQAKTYRFHPPHDGKWQMAFLPYRLGEYSGQADRDLGVKEIQGKKARGFAIDLQKIAPQMSQPQPAEIWIDQETNLPIAIHSEMNAETPLPSDGKTTVTMKTTAITDGDDFQWNLELDPKQFETTPPEGYRDTTLKAPTSGDPVQAIREALKTFPPALNGHYLPMTQSVRAGELEALIDNSDRMRATWEREGFSITIGSEQKKLPPEQLAAALAREATKREGWLHLWALVNEDRDVTYYGKTVTAKDADKVLLRWRLDDGRYQVLYGDLRPEIVTAERLHELEGK